jgi:hypothetical protein
MIYRGSKMKINKKKDFISEMEETLPKDLVQRAKLQAHKEIFLIELKELRKKLGISQQHNKAFSQSGISKLENRKDMKVSTLLEYMDSIGLRVEIKVSPKKPKKNFQKELILLKT